MCACQQYPRFAYKLRSHREKALWWLMATMMSTSSSSCREISSMARSSTQSSILRAWRPSLIRVLTKVPSSLNWTFVLRNQANMSDLSCSTVLPKKTVKQSILSTTQMKISLPSWRGSHRTCLSEVSALAPQSLASRPREVVAMYAAPTLKPFLAGKRPKSVQPIIWTCTAQKAPTMIGT